MTISNEKDQIFKKIKQFASGVEKSFKEKDDIEDLKRRKKEMLKSMARNRSFDDIQSIKQSKKKINRYLASSIVLQKYLEDPLLYQNRKFDIRIWVLVDHMLNVYMFKEGHLKTSSEEYNPISKEPFVHLTNYSIQKYSQNFSKYEYGNEVPFSDLQSFLDKNKIKLNFQSEIIPQIKHLIELSMSSVGKKFYRENSKFSFQIFGYDFIIDKNFKAWLLEINDNPGLSESSPLIKMLVPRMIDDAFRLTLDRLFSTKYSNEVWDSEKNKYKSKFHVTGYEDSEILYDFLCNIDT